MTSTGMGLQSLNAIWPTAQPAARRDVLIMCPDERQREEYAGLFEQRGWKVERSADCRTGIAVAINHDLRMAVIIADRGDRYTGALINCVRSRHPKAAIWLIGNPSELHVKEIAAEHQVLVLPPTTTPPGLEQIVFPQRMRHVREPIE